MIPPLVAPWSRPSQVAPFKVVLHLISDLKSNFFEKFSFPEKISLWTAQNPPLSDLWRRPSQKLALKAMLGFHYMPKTTSWALHTISSQYCTPMGSSARSNMVYMGSRRIFLILIFIFINEISSTIFERTNHRTDFGFLPKCWKFYVV